MADRAKQSLPEQLQRDLAELPESAGVYLMHSSGGKILYIGKAGNLRRRVRSYFSGNKDLKTELLRRKVAHIEVVLCQSEYDALILENNLIKKHKPRYNLRLKDDKSYPLICIGADEYPRIFKTRQLRRDGSQYFGPYPDGVQLQRTLDLVAELFPLRRCLGRLRRRPTPCLYYHTKQCLGPCIGAVSQEDYRRQVQRAKHLLEGRSKTLQAELEQDMRRVSEDRRYEEAARLRDQIRSLQSLEQKQSMELQPRPQVGRDYLAVLSLEDHYFFSVLLLRQGKVLGLHHFSSRYLPGSTEGLPGLPETAEERQAGQSLGGALSSQPEQEGERLTAMLVQFLCQYYLESGHELPDELFLPELRLDWPQLELFLRLLQAQRRRGLQIRPFSRERGAEASSNRLLLLRSRENAIREQQLWLRYQGRGLMLDELRQALGLAQLPKHIEGFDISHLEGQASVASLIVFRQGRPANKEYRSFNLHCTEGHADDALSIQEAVSRRYTRQLNENRELPSLILIDGGQGQVNAAAKVLRSLELDIPLVGLAKREETLYFPAIPYQDAAKDRYSQRRASLQLPPGHAGLKLLQQVRDETHRWAHGKNRLRYQKRQVAGVLENVPGVGQKRSSKLLRHYGSLEELAAAEAADLAKAGGMGLEVAETVIAYLAHRK